LAAHEKGEPALMARVDMRIDCSPGEFRRLVSQPELLLIYEVLALRLERCLMRQIAAILMPGEELPSMTGPGEAPRRASSRTLGREAGGRSERA
jgi:hypothetical protein